MWVRNVFYERIKLQRILWTAAITAITPSAATGMRKETKPIIRNGVVADGYREFMRRIYPDLYS